MRKAKENYIVYLMNKRVSRLVSKEVAFEIAKDRSSEFNSSNYDLRKMTFNLFPADGFDSNMVGYWGHPHRIAVCKMKVPKSERHLYEKHGY